jgi:hypothetical protein
VGAHEEQEKERGDHDEGEQAVIVVEGDDLGFARDQAVEEFRAVDRGGIEHRGERGEAGDVAGQALMRDLGAADEHERCDGDTEGLAQAAAEGLQRGGVGAEVGGERGEGDHGHGVEDEADGGALGEEGGHHLRLGDIRGPAGHGVERGAEAEEADGHELAVVEAGGEAAGELHAEHGAEAAGGERLAGFLHRVAGEVLEVGGHQGG